MGGKASKTSNEVPQEHVSEDHKQSQLILKDIRSHLLELVPLVKGTNSQCVLIGSRAAHMVCSNFRSPNNSTDWDLVVTPKWLLSWLDNNAKNITVQFANF